jgi:hypothetical protein
VTRRHLPTKIKLIIDSSCGTSWLSHFYTKNSMYA